MDERSVSDQVPRQVRKAHAGLLAEVQGAIDLTGDDARRSAHAANVSSWSVHQHLEHLSLADRTIVGWIQSVVDGTAESAGPGKPTGPGTLVLKLGFIPRGRGRAPEATFPAEADGAELASRFATLQRDVAALEASLPLIAQSTVTRRHHHLGHYTAAQWLRFAQVHHVHHGKIINDIVRTAGPR